MMRKWLIFSFFMVSVSAVLAHDKQKLPRVDVISGRKADKAAFEYIESHPNTYIAIVWPRAVGVYEGMKNILAKHATIVCDKYFEMKNYGPHLLYKIAHPGFWHGKIMDHMKNYIPVGTPQPYHFYAIVFETTASLADIIIWKQEIRDYVGISYWSIHTTDNYAETLDLAHIVFDKQMIWNLNHSLTPHSIELPAV